MDDIIAKTIADLCEFASIPSYQGNEAGTRTAADFLARRLHECGFDVQGVPSGAAPYLLADRPAATSRRLIVYLMYDTRAPGAVQASRAEVQSGDTGEILWSALPIGNKAASLAFLAALRSLERRHVPSITVLAEGVESIGSPDLEATVRRLAPGRFDGAYAAFWPRDVRDRQGTARLYLGYRGMLGLRLSAASPAPGSGPSGRPVHSQYRPWVEAPTWRLIDALNVARSIPACEELRAPATGDWGEVLAGTSLKATLADLGARTEQVGEALDAYQRLETDPSLNLEFEAAVSPGVGQIQAVASARLQFRLPPPTTWEATLECLQRELAQAGLDDVECAVTYGMSGATPDSQGSLVDALMEAYRKQQIPVVRWPVGLSTPPVVVFRSQLGLPIADGGAGRVAGIRGGEAVPIDSESHDGIEDQIDFYRQLIAGLAEAAPG